MNCIRDEVGNLNSIKLLRNSYAHFREPMKMVSRTVKENAPVTEIFAKDARRAIQAMARIVKYQSGMGLPRVYRGG